MSSSYHVSGHPGFESSDSDLEGPYKEKTPAELQKMYRKLARHSAKHTFEAIVALLNDVQNDTWIPNPDVPLDIIPQPGSSEACRYDVSFLFQVRKNVSHCLFLRILVLFYFIGIIQGTFLSNQTEVWTCSLPSLLRTGKSCYKMFRPVKYLNFDLYPIKKSYSNKKPYMHM